MKRKLALFLAAAAVLLAAPIHAEEPPTTAHEFHVTGMTCGLCAKAIEKELRGLDGVRDVQIDRKAERVRVVASADLGADRLETAIEGAGSYQADLVNSGPTESAGR